MSRSQIKVVNASINKVETVETDARTWSELEEELRGAGLIKGDVRAVIKENSCSLELGSAEIPEGAFSLFIVPKKSKAGAENYSSWSFSQLRAECASRDSIEGNNGNYGSKEVMIQLLVNDDAAQNQSTDAGSLLLDRLESLISRLESVTATFDSPVPQEVVEEETISEEDRNFINEISNL